MSIFWRHSFGGAPIDEISLAATAAQLVSECEFSADNPGEVLAYCRELDSDTAPAVLYRYLVGIQHQDFVRAIDANPATRFDVRGKKKLLIVPGFFYAEHPDIGAAGDVLLATGAACGFEVARVPTKSLGTVSENAAILAETLYDEPHSDVWLVSLSKGAAEIRLLMQQLGESFPANVKGWLSIAGIAGGTPLAAMKSQSIFHKLFYKGFFPFLGTSFDAVNEMSHDHSFWQEALVLPNNVECIHVVGIPLISHVQPVLVKRYLQLNEYGINDGISLLQSLIAIPGFIYPIWGSDHFLRTPALSPLLYRLLRFIAYGT